MNNLITDEWLPTPLATKALGYSAKTLKRYRDINDGFLVAGQHWNFGPSGASAICWNITQCRKEFHHRGLMRFESAAASRKSTFMTSPALLLGAIASTKAEIKRHEDALQVLMDDLALMYATGEMDDFKDEEGNVSSQGVKVSRCTRTSWQYSNAVKELQQLEQFEGVATKKETEYWRVTLPKAEF